MIGAKFVGGVFDGAEITIGERMPNRIVIEAECHDVNTEDQAFRDAFFANIEEPLRGQFVFCRNAKALRAAYVLHEDENGTPFFKFEGWSVDGVSDNRK